MTIATVTIRTFVRQGLACMAFALAIAAQGSDPLQSPDTIEIRVLREDGLPLPAGTLLQLHTRSFPDPAAPQFWAPSGIGPAVEALVVGNQGAIKVTARTAAIGSVSWLHVERTVDDGMRERAFVPLRPTPDSIVLRREQRLAAGQVVDAAGAAVPAHACQLGVAPPSVGGIPARELLGHRWVQRDGRYELWGWPAPGDFQLTGAYLHFGPAAPPIALEFGGKDLDVVLPVTGHLQVDLPTPKPFPMGAAFVVMRDLDRGGVLRRYLIPNDATNVRVLTGRYAVKLELSGVEVRDFGTLQVLPNQTTEVAHDLRATVRVFRVEVVDPDGKPIFGARVRVVGCPDEPLAPEPRVVDGKIRHVFLVATTKVSVDLEVSEFGAAAAPIVVEGVAGDRVVELKVRRR